FCFFFQAEDGIRDFHVTGVQTCALPIWLYLGADTALPGGWRAGGAIGLHDGRIETDARGTYTDSQSYTAAVYGARQWLVHDSGRSEERRVGEEWRSGRAG